MMSMEMGCTCLGNETLSLHSPIVRTFSYLTSIGILRMATFEKAPRKRTSCTVDLFFIYSFTMFQRQLQQSIYTKKHSRITMSRRRHHSYRRHHHPNQTIHIQHHKDPGHGRTWALLEFGLPLIFFAVIIFSLLIFLKFDLGNPITFIIAAIVSIILAVRASRKLSRFYDRISDYLNGR